MLKIKLKDIIIEDFTNYKQPSMFLITSYCDWKCCIEANCDISICQNSSLSNMKIKEFNIDSIYKSFINNPIIKAVTIGGLEPFKQFDEIYNLIKYFRDKNCTCEFVIYTGYYKEEILNEVNKLSKLSNIIIKFGRYIPNQTSHFDNILGINLASDNQYAEEI